MKNWYQTLIALTLAGVVYLGSSAMAQVPSLVNYQGRLLDSGDNPISGLVAVEVDIYTNSIAGTSVYEEVIGDVNVNNGLFKFQFGAEPGFAQALNHTEAWLELTVDSNPVGQRQRLVAVPYAQVAASVVGDVTVGNVTNVTPSAGAIRWNGEAFEGYTGSQWVLLSPTPIPAPPEGMVLIPEGEYLQGSEQDVIGDSLPVVTTRVSAIYMDIYEVTQDLWDDVVIGYASANGYDLAIGYGIGPNHPVQQVTWYDCVKWCNARSEKAGFKPAYYTDSARTQVYRSGVNNNIYVDWNASAYRLPTEAEWEKAARGGAAGYRFPWGNDISHDEANYTGGSGGYDLETGGFHPKTLPPFQSNLVHTLQVDDPDFDPFEYTSNTLFADGYGLYQMAGNVSEWCWDWNAPYTGGTNPRGPFEDPTGAFEEGERVHRGGSWETAASAVRIAQRAVRDPDVDTSSDDLGFRTVLVPPKP